MYKYISTYGWQAQCTRRMRRDSHFNYIEPVAFIDLCFYLNYTGSGRIIYFSRRYNVLDLTSEPRPPALICAAAVLPRMFFSSCRGRHHVVYRVDPRNPLRRKTYYTRNNKCVTCNAAEQQVNVYVYTYTI